MIKVTRNNGITCIVDTEEGEGDGSHLDVYDIDVPQLIVDLLKSGGIDAEQIPGFMDLLS